MELRGIVRSAVMAAAVMWALWAAGCSKKAEPTLETSGAPTDASGGDAQANNVGGVRAWECGDSGGNVIATMKDDVTLVISGTGAMANYGDGVERFRSVAPWYNIKDGITSVVIEHGVTSIGTHAFDGFIGLTSVAIPNSVKRIHRGAFYNCSALTSVTIPRDVIQIGQWAFGHTGLKSVEIPDSVYNIVAGVFMYCENLTSVKFGNRVRYIGATAFEGCINLTAITIPKRVEEIEYMAFIECTNMTSIIVHPPKPPYGGKGWVFGSNDKNKNEIYFNEACLYVPESSVVAYRADVGWKQFKCIKPIESAPTGGKYGADHP